MSQPRRWRRTKDPAGEFPLDLINYAFHLFAVVARHREARLEAAMRPLGLNLTRHRCLAVIQALEPCTMTALAEFSAVDRTTLTRTVDPLVKQGWVERVTPASDRRQVVLTLTDAGRDVCAKSLREVFRVNRHLLDGLPDEADRRAMTRGLELFLGRLVDDPELLKRLSLRDEE
jgi:DNA-binding MarR family transcriptional regulator